MQPSSDHPLLVGIDVGTSSVRAIAFDTQGRQIAAGSRRTPIVPTDTGGEYDPDTLFATALAALADLGAALAGRPVTGIAVASIGESCVLVDRSGRPLAPSIAWYDRRAEAEAAAIAATVGRDRIFSISGHAAEHIFTLNKLVWMRKHWPDVMAKASHVLMMADWIAFRLSGEAATDPSLASRTLYYDIRRRAWSAEMLALAGVGTDFPAPLMASGTALGPVRREIFEATGLAGSPVVAVGGHDHVLGAFATGLTRPGTMVNSLGTAEALLLATAAPLDDPEAVRRGYVQGAMETDRQMSYLAASLYSSGGAVDWVRSLVGDAPLAVLIAEAAAVPPGSNGVVFLPHLANGPPPDPDPDARGAFVGLTPATNRAVLYRAVLEGLAFQSRLMLNGMATLGFIGEPREIRLIGGGSRNPLFLTIKANVFGRPLIVVDEAEGTALGAALLGGIAAGLFPGLEAALRGLDRSEHVVEPDSTAPRYDALRTMVFEHIHDRLRPINRGLAEFNAMKGPGPG